MGQHVRAWSTGQHEAPVGLQWKRPMGRQQRSMGQLERARPISQHEASMRQREQPMGQQKQSMGHREHVWPMGQNEVPVGQR